MNKGVMLRRGATKRCAVCGGGRLFHGWFRMKEHCPTCATRFEREPGFFGGALFVNFALTEIVMFGWLAGVAIATIPKPDIAWLIGGSIAICVVVPIALYPFSKTLWFAIHLAMQPLDADELAESAATRFERGDGASQVPFAVGVSEHPVPALAIGEAVGQVLDGGGTGPDVLFVFADLALSGALDDIVVTLHRLLRPVVLVGATAPAVLAHARTLRRKRGLALLAGYGFVATASRTVDGLDGAEPALTLVEPGGHHLLLDHDVYDLGTVHVAIDGVDVEHVHLRDSEDLRGRHFDGALLFGRGRVRYDEELTLRLDAPVVGMTASGPVGPAPLPTIVLFGDAG